MQLNQVCSELFERNIDSDSRITVNRGGTRSTKTYSLLQMWIEISFTCKNLNILITRKHFPQLRLSVLRDFLDILNNTCIRTGRRIDGQGMTACDCEDHVTLSQYFHYHKTHSYFENKQTGTKIHFVSSDDEQKVRGAKWDFVHINEGNEVPFDTFRQFLLRTPAKIYIDFNPSDTDTWINTEVEQKREDCNVIQSSYLDNPFLPETIINEIEYLRDTDMNFWHIYGLGEYGNVTNKIYTHIKPISLSEYRKIVSTDRFAGLDFGYVHPTVLVEMKYTREAVFGHTVYCESYKDTTDLMRAMRKAKFPLTQPIYADPAAPTDIRRLRNAGYTIGKAKKDVREGINTVRSLPIYWTRESVQFWKEVNKYKYKEIDGKLLEGVPVKFDDDNMDAMRYGIYSHIRRRVVRGAV